jgi:hypothetical protein
MDHVMLPALGSLVMTGGIIEVQFGITEEAIHRLQESLYILKTFNDLVSFLEGIWEHLVQGHDEVSFFVHGAGVDSCHRNFQVPFDQEGIQSKMDVPDFQVLQGAGADISSRMSFGGAIQDAILFGVDEFGGAEEAFHEKAFMLARR